MHEQGVDRAAPRRADDDPQALLGDQAPRRDAERGRFAAPAVGGEHQRSSRSAHRQCADRCHRVGLIWCRRLRRSRSCADSVTRCSDGDGIAGIGRISGLGSISDGGSTGRLSRRRSI